MGQLGKGCPHHSGGDGARASEGGPDDVPKIPSVMPSPDTPAQWPVPVEAPDRNAWPEPAS